MAGSSFDNLDSASFTEVITDLKEQVEKLTRQNEVDALDRDWEAEKERFMVTGKHGHRHLPTRTGSLVGGIMIAVFGIFWTAIAAGMAGFAGGFGGGPFGRLFSCFPLFGVVFIVFGIGMSIVSYNKVHLRTQRRTTGVVGLSSSGPPLRLLAAGVPSIHVDGLTTSGTKPPGWRRSAHGR